MENLISLTLAAALAIASPAAAAEVHRASAACHAVTGERRVEASCPPVHPSRIHGYTRERKGL